MSNYTKDNLIPLTPDSVPKGALAIKIGDEIFTPMNPDRGTDTSDATVTASDVSEGLVFYGKDGKETGTMPDVTVTKSGNVVTVPVGRVRTEQTIEVGLARSGEEFLPSTQDLTLTANTYLTGDFVIKGDTNLASENIKSGVSIFGVPGAFEGGSSMEFYRCADVAQGDQGGQYYEVSNASQWPDCNGKYYLTDLVCPLPGASPVYKHETADLYMFGNTDTDTIQIAGDYNGNSTPFYRYYGYSQIQGQPFPESGWDEVDYMEDDLQVSLKTSAPTEKTWSGYKAVWSDSDGYTFEETATEGLSYGTGFVPKLGGIYNDNATIEITKLFETVKPITTNDSSCLIYIDGTTLANQALAPNKHEVTFGSGVTSNGTLLITPNDSSGRITTQTKTDGYGGNLDEWTMDICARADSQHCYLSGHSNSGWCIQSLYNGAWEFRSGFTLMPRDSDYSKLFCISVQYNKGTVYVWNAGKYVGEVVYNAPVAADATFGIGTDGDPNTSMADAIRLFRFSNKSRYTPGVDFELPEGFLNG